MGGRGGLAGLLQLADSAFPAGGFAHSDGIEALVRLGVVNDGASLEAVLVAHRRLTLGPADGWFAITAHAATTRRDAPGLRASAREDLGSRAAAGAREASLALGRALIRAAAAAALPGDERDAVDWVEETLGEAAPRASAFGAIASAFGAPAGDAAAAFAFSVLAGMVAAAVRLRVVGPAEGQRILRRATSHGPTASADGWASFSPLLDIAAMRHETLEQRLFAS